MTPPVRSETVLRQTARQINIIEKIGYYLAPILIMVTDYIAIVAALLIAAYFRGGFLTHYFSSLSKFHISNTYTYFLIPLTYLAFLAYEGLYTKRQPFWQSVESIFRICTYVSIVAIGIMYFTRVSQASRIFIVTAWLLSFASLTVMRFVVKKVLVMFHLWEKHVVIVGAGKTAEILAKTFAEEQNLGYKIVGLVEDNYCDRPLVQQYPHIGNFAHLEQAIVTSGVQEVVLATPGVERKELVNLVYRIQPLVKNLTIVPDLFGVPLNNMNVETIFSEKTVLLKIRNNMMVNSNRVFKRAFDLIGCCIGIFLISPILLGIAIAIYVNSPGPIIFAHRRIGANGQSFPCYKFRSMVINAQKKLEDYLAENPAAREEWERDFKLKDDPRITSIGKFLRKTSLDELPQLFNVIKGEMSLVGPRPIIDKEVPKYGEYINDYYLVRPGITGFWQVSGRSDVDYDSRVQMDSWYVRNWSVWLDIILLFKTVKVVIKRKGAY